MIRAPSRDRATAPGNAHQRLRGHQECEIVGVRQDLDHVNNVLFGRRVLVDLGGTCLGQHAPKG
jgi:hypothetical protein